MLTNGVEDAKTLNHKILSVFRSGSLAPRLQVGVSLLDDLVALRCQILIGIVDIACSKWNQG